MLSWKCYRLERPQVAIRRHNCHLLYTSYLHFQWLRMTLTLTKTRYEFLFTGKSVCRLWRSCALLRGWNFRQYFFRHFVPSRPLTSMQNFTEIVPGNLSSGHRLMNILKTSLIGARGGVKHKRGSKIQRCYVLVSHLLVSFYCNNSLYATQCRFLRTE